MRQSFKKYYIELSENTDTTFSSYFYAKIIVIFLFIPCEMFDNTYFQL